MDKKHSLSINMIGNGHISEEAMDGGTRIFIEWARGCSKRGVAVNVFTTSEGFGICRNSALDNVNYVIWPSLRFFMRFGLYALFIARTTNGCLKAMRMPSKAAQKTIIYSSSDFWYDSLPGFLMARRIKGAKWVAALYLFAPNPLSKESPYKGKRFLRGLLYYLSQRPVYWLIKRYADMVFVTSEPDAKKFVTKKRGIDKVIVVRGGVDIKPSEEYLNSGNIISPEKKKYDTCFVGRFHPQKGVLELIDIWKLVCESKPEAKLAMIGDGSLKDELKQKIRNNNLKKNIDLLGFKDGEEKYEIFKQSKIIVHPAIYDSGGMAACEAMAWGLPGVSFDLEALKTYYPKGMIKTPCYDLEGFAINILKLLDDKELYEKAKDDAIAWAKEWDWNKRAENILQQIKLHLLEDWNIENQRYTRKDIELKCVRCAICYGNKKELLIEAKNTHGSLLISQERFRLVKCKDCGLVYINPRPKKDEIGKFYNIDYYTTGNRFKKFIEKYLTHYTNLRKKELVAKYKLAGKLLDIGCGTGEFLSSFISGKWDLYGIEPNSRGFNLSCKRVKGKIFNNKLSDCKFSNNYFDVITMWHVFEHLYDPNKELREINRILKDDGILIIEVPNVKSLGFKMAREHWFHLDSPRHLYHYDSTTINKILNKSGFKVLKIAYPFTEYPLDLYHSLINSLRKNKFIRMPLMLPLLIVTLLLKPVCSLLKASETMTVVCRKGT